jgi:D-alanine--D-alanine ligase
VQALKKKGHHAVGIDVSEDTLESQLLAEDVDVAFIALHGRFGEDGRVQQICETLRIPYTGSGVQASRIAIDKIRTKEVLVRQAIPTARFKTVPVGKRGPTAEAVLGGLRLPVVVKPSLEGSSIGLSIVTQADKLGDALEKAFACKSDVLIEEYIAGKELTVGILENRALPIIQVVPKNKFYDYQAKYTKGMTEYIIPAPIDEADWVEAQSLAVRTHREIGCEDMSRVDLILGNDNRLYVLEINTIPGFTETSLLPKAAQAAGIGFEDLCEQIVTMGAAKRRRFGNCRRGRTTSSRTPITGEHEESKSILDAAP